MGRNVEIKARAHDFSAQRLLAEEAADAAVETLEQVDTFFSVASGRLKLREFRATGVEAKLADKAQLIFYKRADQNGPKLSDYHITDIDDAISFKKLMAEACGVRQTVVKTRYLYLAGQTRIHFDQVQDLGEFIELEVVLDPSQTLDEGQVQAQALMQSLSIATRDLVDVAYVDLLEARQ